MISCSIGIFIMFPSHGMSWGPQNSSRSLGMGRHSMGVVHVYACAKRYRCGMRTYLLFNGPPSIPKVLNQTFAKLTTDKIGQLDGNGANHEHQWLQQLFRLGCTKGNPKRQRGTRHIPCTREIRFKQQILDDFGKTFTSFHFISLPPFANLDHLGVT